MDIKHIFTALVLRHTTNTEMTEKLWHEIEKAYTAKGRYYHNLTHLENMYAQLESVKDLVSDWDALLFSLFYHDVVYDASKKNNEEKSADFAVKRLVEINYPQEKISLCHEQIMATKQHSLSANADTNLLTDADLSILGAPWASYEAYSSNVRREYSIYPDFLYKPGRRKALVHFLEMETIFKTEYFKTRFEAAARENIRLEISKF